MEKFAQLIQKLEVSNKTTDKIDAIVSYFDIADDKDKIWLLALFTGKRPRRPVKTALLKQWAMEQAQIPEWLFFECYHSVGDLGETIALLLPPATQKKEQALHIWVTELIDLQKKDDAAKKEYVLQAWDSLDFPERFIFNKLIGGGFRVGVSQKILVNAIAKHNGLEANSIMHSIMGNWQPQTSSYHSLISGENINANLSAPYPFCLAYPLEQEPLELGAPEEWLAEWKWDGIRGQVIKRGGEIFIWSRGEELVTAQFPELASLIDLLPDGIVIDGEILARENETILSFNHLQQRLNRKNITKKMMETIPIVFYAYDLLEYNGEDIRNQSMKERRAILEKMLEQLPSQNIFHLSPKINFSSWNELTEMRKQSREQNSEGIMLKRLHAPYHTGRKKGDWWKWKVNPYTVDTVMIYAQKGSGKRANFYTDYTFAVKDGEQYVTIAKAYSGLTDKEIMDVDRFVKKNAIEKFGPVRTVKPELVFEIAFEGIAASKRHKAGVALRFPRILRWRKDKTVKDINTLDDLKELLK